MEIVQSKSGTIVYRHPRSRRIGMVSMFALVIGGMVAVMLSDLAKSETGQIVSVASELHKNGRHLTLTLRDSKGNVSRLDGHLPAFEGAKPGDPYCKSPGNMALHRLPTGTPPPEPQWFRFGYGDLYFVALGFALALVIVQASMFWYCQRVVFDPAAEVVRQETRVLWSHYARMVHPLSWLRGCLILPYADRDGFTWRVVMVGKTKSCDIGYLNSESEAQQRVASLKEFLPLLDAKS